MIPLVLSHPIFKPSGNFISANVKIYLKSDYVFQPPLLPHGLNQCHLLLGLMQQLPNWSPSFQICPTTGPSCLANRIFLDNSGLVIFYIKLSTGSCFTRRTHSPYSGLPCPAQSAQSFLRMTTSTSFFPTTLSSLTLHTHTYLLFVHKQPRHIPTRGPQHWLIPRPRNLFPGY